MVNNDSQTALVITDVFPPLPAVGIHRTVAMCRHLAERDWGVTVITARPGADAAIDEGLLDGVSEDVQVVRTAAPDLLGIVTGIFRRRRQEDSPEQAGIAAEASRSSGQRPSHFRRMVDWMSWWFHIPDGSIGWLIPAVLAGLREARKHRPEVIYSSAPMWTSHLAAGVLSRLLRVPWVADFRDPWCGNQWRQIPYRLHRKTDNLLEGLVVCRASQITCAWDGIRKHLMSRYPMKAKYITTILNGFDPEQIDSVSPVSLDSSRCVLLHAGTLYGPRSPIPLLEGLRCFRKESPAEAGRLLVVFLGLPSYNGRPLADIVSEYGVGGLVRIIPPTTHRQALAYLKGTDVAVLFG
ncbi:MAG: glycosyltransferase, partial [Phycisphaerae bacterium]|nr:glycosyltransferase [Phycisphaerae bacterium]